eukprot:TRINITY_DN10316_c0_g1_i2.p1 TRINITY_DN10316_c0_g1~~TRINITY_DN10316_c0_g1_i2.p1  ORF type:complete len:613 (-),score=180.00 TRINITY_DN10316_c0_g1_i2:124-1731(-)
MTDMSGHYYFDVEMNVPYIIRIPIAVNEAKIKFPTLVNQGFDCAKNSKGHLMTYGGIKYAAAAVMATTDSGDMNVDFGFICVVCKLSTNLYDSENWDAESQVPGTTESLSWLDTINFNDDDEKDEDCDEDECSGVPLKLTAWDSAGSACLTFSAPSGVSVKRFDYFALSGPNNPISVDSVITSASHFGGDITNKITIEQYVPGRKPCESAACPGFDPLSNTNFSLAEGDIVVCMGCVGQGFLTTPVEVCFAETTATDFSHVAVKGSLRGIQGYCHMHSAKVYGVLPQGCYVSDADCVEEPLCSGLESDIFCNIPCYNDVPLDAYTSSTEDDIICIEFYPNEKPDVRIPSVEYLTFEKDTSPLDGAIIYSVTNEWGEDITNEVFIEHYQSGRICGSIPSCPSYKEQFYGVYDAMPGDTNICFNCGNNNSWLGDWVDDNDDDSDHDSAYANFTGLPLNICFKKAGYSHVDFEGAKVKIRVNHVEGWCGSSTFQVVAEFKPCEPIPEDPLTTVGNDDNFGNDLDSRWVEVHHNDDDDD